jgi:hypothetical protein
MHKARENAGLRRMKSEPSKYIAPALKTEAVRTSETSAIVYQFTCQNTALSDVNVVHPVFLSALCVSTARVKCRSLLLETGRECV